MTAVPLRATLDRATSSMSRASGSLMCRNREKFTQRWVIDTQCWVDGWRRMYPHKPAYYVARDLGAPLRTVEKWFTGEAGPGRSLFGPVLCQYGLAFVLSGMPSPADHLRDLARAETRARLLAEREAIDTLLDDGPAPENDA